MTTEQTNASFPLEGLHSKAIIERGKVWGTHVNCVFLPDKPYDLQCVERPSHFLGQRGELGYPFFIGNTVIEIARQILFLPIRLDMGISPCLKDLDECPLFGFAQGNRYSGRISPILFAQV